MSILQVGVVIQDINDTPPKFKKDSYFEFVSENIPVGTIIAELKASDADSASNTNLTYSFAKNSGKGKTAINQRHLIDHLRK